jgi:hypothetical protein
MDYKWVGSTTLKAPSGPKCCDFKVQTLSSLMQCSLGFLWQTISLGYC